MLRRVPGPTSEPATAHTGGDDSALVERARDGDRDAQQRLLLSHVERVRGLITRLVGGGPDVDDLLQVTCVETLRSLKRYRGDASFAFWMDRIATHTVYKHFRTNRRRRARIVPVEDPDRAPDALDEARRLEWRDAVARARELLGRVKPQRRIVFLLVAVEGRTVEEAAAMLDLSLSAAKSRYLRARRDVDALLVERPELGALLGRADAERREARHG